MSDEQNDPGDDTRDEALISAFASYQPAVEERMSQLEGVTDRAWEALAADDKTQSAQTCEPSADGLEIKTLGLRVLTDRCGYCHGEALTPAETVLCQACLAPHHEACFGLHDACSAPGCGCRNYLRPTPLGPPRRERLRRRNVFVAAAALLVGAAALAPSAVRKIVREVDLHHARQFGEVDSEFTDQIHERVALLLEAGRWREAEGALEAAQRAVRAQDLQGADVELGLLREMVALMGDDPLTVRWNLVLRCGVRAAPYRSRAWSLWVFETQERAEWNLAAIVALEQGEEALVGVQGCLPGDPDAAQLQLDRVQQSLADAPLDHDLVPHLARLEARAIEAGWLIAAARVQVALGAKFVEWDAVRLLAAEASSKTGDSAERRAQIKAWLVQCDIEQQAEADYAVAAEIVRDRRTDDYEQALRLLASVPAETALYADALSYIDWIDADSKVREARRAYDEGDEQRAFLLLNEALRHEALGPEARASVRTRRQKWAKVARHFAVGMQQFRAGRSLEAQREFEAVLQSEPNRENRFHAMAREQLNQVIPTKALTKGRKLRKGIEALDRGELEKALGWFSMVKTDPDVEPADLERISTAVADALDQERWLDAIQWHVAEDRVEHFLEDYYTLKLLKDWLPPDHLESATVRRYHEQVRARLQAVLRNHREPEDER